MYSFYSAPVAAETALMLLMIAAFVMQAVWSILTMMQYRNSRYYVLMICSEYALTAHILVWVMVCGYGLYTKFSGFVPGLQFMQLRYIQLFVTGLFISSYICYRKKNMLAAALLTLVMIPWMRSGMQAWYFPLLSAAGLLFMARSIFLIAEDRKYLHTHLSAMSVHDAVDTLSDGIMFAARNGSIMLQNHAMMEIMHRIFGNEILNADTLWDMIIGYEDTDSIKHILLEDGIVFRMGDESWNFTRNRLTDGKYVFTQIQAVCITELDKINRELEDNTEFLRENAKKTEQLLINYEQVQTEQEILRARSAVHDVMGQRMAIINQFIHQMDNKGSMSPDEQESMMVVLENLLKEGITDKIQDPAGMLEGLKDSFNVIGVMLVIKGTLPEDYVIAMTIVKIIREAATNAVRHGNADMIEVFIRRDFNNAEASDGYSVTVSNNGDIPGAIVEGTGFKGMNYYLQSAGGLMTIDKSKQFTINAWIPCSQKDTAEETEEP